MNFYSNWLALVREVQLIETQLYGRHLCDIIAILKRGMFVTDQTTIQTLSKVLTMTNPFVEGLEFSEVFGGSYKLSYCWCQSRVKLSLIRLEALHVCLQSDEAENVEILGDSTPKSLRVHLDAH